MSVATATRTAARPAPGASALAGTRGLVRLALRADRVRVVVWALAVGAAALGMVAALDGAYTTPEAYAARATLIASPAATVLAGPGYGLDDYDLGAMTANEVGLWLMVPVAVMALLTVTRHLRGAEEDGRLELVRSGPVGRDAPVVAGLVAAAVATTAVGACVLLGLVVAGLPWTGSLALASGVVAVGWVFAAVSAVTSQLAAHARTASALAMGALGVAFLLRAVGDVRGPQSTSVLTWLSPFGWAQATRAYVDERWWPLLVALAATALTVAVAFALVGRRDHGTGLLPARLGRPAARRTLTGLVALTARRQSTAWLSWSAGLWLSAALIGLLAPQVVDFARDDPDLVALMGAGAAPTATELLDSAFALYGFFVALLAVCYAVSGVGAARAEEESTRAGLVLAHPVSRVRWLGAQAAVVLLGAVVALVLGGLVMGLTAASSLDDPAQVGRLTAAAAVLAVPTTCVGALAVLVVGAVPRAYAATWAYVAYVGVVGMFGPLLPDGADAASPFTPVPSLPAEPMDVGPVLVVAAVAAVLLVVGLAAFRRRDLRA